MTEETKSKINQARDSISRLTSNIDKKTEAWSDEGKAFWNRFKKQIAIVKDRLADASQKLETSTDEAKVQTHLALMEAEEQWDELQETIETFIRESKNVSRPVMDQAVLQAHLARLEARDLIKVSAEELLEKYENSKAKLEKASLSAATRISERCKGIIEGLPKV